uniref:hypothetical protein n=1 Tax=Hoylesella pleuritidis TaxID=407975 RepID=UPI00286878FF|nr:hypothetical protein [Hoylesella pleuritidis]
MAERRVEKHEMFDPATLDFIRQHVDDDVRLLALQATRWPAWTFGGRSTRLRGAGRHEPNCRRGLP